MIGNTEKAQPRWGFVPYYNTPEAKQKFIKNLTLNNNFCDVFIKSKKTDLYSDYVRTTVENSSGENLGSDFYSINKDNGNIDEIEIEIEKNYRQQKSLRLGEKLKLVTIMELLENSGNNINITSKDTAIYFHSRYKFVPCVKRFSTCCSMLNDVIKDKSEGFEDFSKEAEILINQFKEFNDNAEIKRKLAVKTNDLVRRYIERALSGSNPQEKHPINSCIEMVLTRDAILENKDYFNKLFESNGIDYCIK